MAKIPWRDCRDCKTFHEGNCKPFCGPNAENYWDHSYLEVDVLCREKNESASIRICKRCGRSSIELGIESGGFGYRDTDRAEVLIFPGKDK